MDAIEKQVHNIGLIIFGPLGMIIGLIFAWAAKSDLSWYFLAPAIGYVLGYLFVWVIFVWVRMNQVG